QILVIAVALPPVLLFLTHLSKIALHDNCRNKISANHLDSRRFLLHAWATAFLVCIIMHLSFVLLDLITGNYIPEHNHDPPNRLLIFASRDVLPLREI
ncbi:hypothetical protein PMAYCL1PPCAC_16737, partial [Pristionchus mayeri]